VGRAGGGGGAGSSGGGSATDGGGAGQNGGTLGSNGSALTGGGGGGVHSTSSAVGSQGGSGVVIFTVSDNALVRFSEGVSAASTLVGGNRVYTVTATSTTSETVTIG
jgi:hypothetical protein